MVLRTAVKILLAASGCLVVVAFAEAQIDVDKPPAALTPRHNNVALVVGIERYQRAPHVPYAARDAETVRSYLVQAMGFREENILSFVDNDATYLNLTRTAPRQLKSLLTESIKQEPELLLFYYAGHGMPDAATQANYLVPADADLEDIASTGYPLRQLYEDLAALPVKCVLIVLDACFSGATARGSGSEGLRKGSRPGIIVKEGGALPDKVAVLAAASGNQVSGAYDAARHGLFTYYLLRGLRGEARPDSSGWVSFGELSNFVTDGVRAEAARLRHAPQAPSLRSGEGLSPAAIKLLKPAPGIAAAAVLAAPARTTPAPAVSRPAAQVGADGLEYVYIPPGMFMMGCSPGDSECNKDEKPAHRVTITKGFWMSQTEVTVGGYKRFAAAAGRGMPEEPKYRDRALNPGWSDEQQPVAMVTWDDAAAYCRWAGGRLPTEAEWEYAARGGTNGSRYGDLDGIAWYADNSGRLPLDSATLSKDPKSYVQRLLDNQNGPHKVGQKVPNGFGLYDMLGNAWEWVADWYADNYYASSPASDPTGPSSGSWRMLRGGSWSYNLWFTRVSNRIRDVPGVRYHDFGFRCVQEVIPLAAILPEKPRMEKAYGLIQVTADAGGTLSIDGQKVAELKPFARYTTGSIEAGPHQVRVERPGYQAAEQRVLVLPNQTAAAELKLAPSGTGFQPVAPAVPETKKARPAAGPTPQTQTDAGGLAYVWIPPGTFMMGCSPGDSECMSEEKPAHRLTITRGFWMGQTEVTVAAYKRFAAATGGRLPAAPSFNASWKLEDHPIVDVRWDEAVAYCRWAGGRLPTEAEWEYAARAGTTGASYGDLSDIAWYGADFRNQTHAVGQKAPNAFGLYDMLGNAWEWVADWYGGNYYAHSPSQDPRGPSSGQFRVRRGGSWYYYPRSARASYRGGPETGIWDGSIGFRCVREAPPGQ